MKKLLIALGLIATASFLIYQTRPSEIKKNGSAEIKIATKNTVEQTYNNAPSNIKSSENKKTKPKSNSTDETNSEPSPLEVKNSKYADAIKQWEKESVDYDWAQKEEQKIREFSNEFLTIGISISDLNCKATHCKFNLNTTDPESSNAGLFYRKMFMSPSFQNFTIYKAPTENPTSHGFIVIKPF